MIPERITSSTPELEREGHEFRYRLAAGFAAYNDWVLDAACGTGYGSKFFSHSHFYRGVDKDPQYPDSAYRKFIAADLESWEPISEGFDTTFPFDVAISFETIEHLPNYDHFITVLKRAKKWILVSVPVVPTVGINPWHVHDFAPGEMVGLFEDDDWRLYQMVQQPSESSEIYVFCRR